MNWIIFTPEIYTFVVSGVFFCLSLNKPDSRRDYYTALILSAIGLGVCLSAVHMNGTLFSNTYQVDLFSQVFKVMLFMALFLVICLCSELNGVDENRHSEFYMLLCVCTLSMMMLISSVNILTMYIALELSSYSLYILVFMRKHKKYSVNTGIKYFIIGASASALMVFGMAMLYGATGVSFIPDIVQIIPGIIYKPEVITGLFFTLSGFFFKLAVFPFHFWAPDVYEGAPNQLSAYIATASKVTVIAVLARMISMTGGNSQYLVHAMAVLAIITMTIGNLTAVVQKDLKRLFAFSSIAHAGYVLIAILSMNAAGYTAAVFYALTVLVLKFTCFLVLIKVADDGQNINVDHLAGLHKRSPLLAMALMLALFGLAGIPPTIGFTGKLLIFMAAMEKGYFILVLIAMINVVISLYYYLLVVKAAYLTEPEKELPEIHISPFIKILTITLVAITVLAGIIPNYLIEIARAAASVLI
ncbi:NADH-quinone oxidoreductase, subunit N [Desulfonema limicola]|uniref:NADH-quinone oxidoreductase subunit N n=1 Tax=Desulfonema limicola TaxID=45656 RepID=A0A975GGF9_9BACT|nr:NADH-quinone oxidoreductase subunit N [Desulfonema limicola]QTA80204.1 NADH-quinone oxidoreductase, subunit N [Desulfonema limicola]